MLYLLTLTYLPIQSISLHGVYSTSVYSKQYNYNSSKVYTLLVNYIYTCKYILYMSLCIYNMYTIYSYLCIYEWIKGGAGARLFRV